ncbi:Ca-activated chloride channel family protein [Aliiruegeria haliotis]|uniref:Ca-activated chloride channel family protein n=1 Tax=Aliiruegeria haliotis TaxID=1280846 RepID=A0A2T0S0A7_9RHOB|nr:VWA domain-containing protein [Aliiruegeria haliotis]PRY26802.1 Ca-activated chloride channel family protein [Aliiruegeria haliotis]
MTLALAFPWALLLLPLPLLVWRFAPPHRHRSTAIRVPFFRQITEAAGLEPRDGSVVLRRRRIQVIAAALCWCLLVLGLARPELLGQKQVVEKAARDLALAVDISGSMDARDMPDATGERQQRLQVVKDVVGDFIEERDGDRVALIVFGTRAFVQTPFTEDLESVRDLLDSTTVGMAGVDTAIGDAIGLAIRTFETSEVDQRLLVLLSDGADTSSSMSPVNAAEIAAQRGVTIHTIGVGDPKADGADKVDLRALEDIAARAGGAFYYASDGEGLQKIYDEIERLNPRITESVSFQPKQPMHKLPFGLAVLIGLLTTWWLHLSSRRVA